MDETYVETMTRLVDRELPGLPAELIHLYTLLALTRGQNVTLVDVHDAWAIWRTTTQPDHKSIVPFGDLTPEVRELDRKYAEGIQRAVNEYMATIESRRQ